MRKTDESYGIKKYIQYIKSRTKLLKISAVEASDNQISYFNALYIAILIYSKTHKLYMRYVMHKLTFEDIKAILGEHDRQVFRYLERQRKLLIDYITEKEIEYFAKYHFEERIKITGDVINEII